ncbi:hypothetical protein SUTMEG_08830 [Sutterella megalosphaeroides]|uniref:Uncharacterized protein n=1 Tax=Sutterella megalosphaeroides TaxID=2494234 RepID=A0A2Z6I9H5_9BURK|nr:hypothetical protein SUTMEG_08830 [Sutterella megalosphaeroides]
MSDELSALRATRKEPSAVAFSPTTMVVHILESLQESAPAGCGPRPRETVEGSDPSVAVK